MSQAVRKPGDEAFFAAIEEAVMQSPRGRWFLAEYGRRCRAFETDRILEAIGRLQSHVADERASSHLDILRRELQDMSAAIVQTRREIAAMKPAEGATNRIMAATEELDAVVTATERATSDILSCAERIQDIAVRLRNAGAPPAECDALDAQVTEIFTACSFQDITGQRTTKVVNVLRYLEQRVNAMIEIWGDPGAGAQAPAEPAADARPDAHLMNGPARTGEGVSQADVDALFGPAAGTASQADIDNLFP